MCVCVCVRARARVFAYLFVFDTLAKTPGARAGVGGGGSSAVFGDGFPLTVMVKAPLASFAHRL